MVWACGGWTKGAVELQAPNDEGTEPSWAVGKARPAGAPVLGLGAGLPGLGMRK